MSQITRRDFVNGAALTIAAGLTPMAQLAAEPARYPPALTGLRGQHRRLVRDRACRSRVRRGRFAAGDWPIEERYDLVVVGGGISGLSAAWFYRRARPDARILILDNHDDFGGHAKRNEFTLDGRLIIGYGGSQSMQSPNTLWSTTAKGLLRDLGVDLERFETAFDRTLYPSLGLSTGLFLPREAFGARCAGARRWTGRFRATTRRAGCRMPGRSPNSSPDCRSPEASKAQLLALYDKTRDPLAGRSRSRKARMLKRPAIAIT